MVQSIGHPFEAAAVNPHEGITAMELTFWNIPEVLAHTFPELRLQITEHLREARQAQARPYPHQFLESYLLPRLTTVTPTREAGTRQRALTLLEQLLGHEDEDLVSATLLNVLEPLVDNPTWMQRVESELGPNALHWIGVIRGCNGT
jgi:hypothetical protein